MYFSNCLNSLEDKRNEAEAATEAGYDEPEAFPSHPPIIIFTRILDFVEDLKEGAYRKIQKWQDDAATEEYVDALFGLIDGLEWVREGDVVWVSEYSRLQIMFFIMGIVHK